jgi:hypothetical protein
MKTPRSISSGSYGSKTNLGLHSREVKIGFAWRHWRKAQSFRPIDLCGRMRHGGAWLDRHRLFPSICARLEAARLNFLALFRALERMDLCAADIPQRLLRQLFELDADYAEALWALDPPPRRLNLRLMFRDRLASRNGSRKLAAAFEKTSPNAPIPPWRSLRRPLVRH